MRAIILAGGKGTRLRPYTVAIPKPLVPISGDMPIIEVLIKQLKKCGFDHITIAVSHMAEIIMAYAGDGSKWGIKVDYSLEKEQLHTIGALTIVPDLPEHFLVVNGDTLTDLHYGEFLKEHISRNSDISISAKKREVKVDFGVLTFNEEYILTDFSEKPTHYAHVAMGVNCFNRSVIESLPKAAWYGFDDLMKDGLKEKKKIWVKSFDGFWIDIGRPEDYQYTVEHSEEIKQFLEVGSKPSLK